MARDRPLSEGAVARVPRAMTRYELLAFTGRASASSRASGRPKATLSRRVRDLEEALGVRLIERGSRELRLTEEGAALHAQTAPLLSEVEDAAQAVASGLNAPRGRLRVSAPVVFSQVALPAFAAGFVRRHPQVHLEIVAEDRQVDPVEEGYDIAIRIDPKPDDRLVGRAFLRDERVVVAPPDLPRPADSDESFPSVVLTNHGAGAVWRLQDGAVLTPEPRLSFSTYLMVREAVLAGAGAALLPRLAVGRDLEAGRLVCWGVYAGAPVEIWRLHSSRRLVSAKVRAFLEEIDADFVAG